MGTNFYARIIPKKEDKQKIIDAINKNQFNIIEEEYKRLYSYSNSYDKGGIIHLGKRSGGWKFLWNPNVRESISGLIDESLGWTKGNFTYEYDYIYPLTKQGISDFLHRDDIMIVSEYYNDNDIDNIDSDDNPTADEFLEMAFNWCKDDGFDSNTYREYQIKNGERYYDWDDTERCDKWRRLGFKVNNGCDFYSDGLRFSTSLEFS